MNPAWSPEVSSWVVPIDLAELVTKGQRHCRIFLPLGSLVTHSQDVDPLCNEEVPLLHNRETEASISLCGQSQYSGALPTISSEPASRTGRKTKKNVACWTEGRPLAI